MENYPKPVTKESHKQIMDYLDNSIYQIKGCKEKVGIGFFCSLRCRDKKIFVLITNYQIIDESYFENFDYIDVLINQKLIRIEFNLINYFNKKLDLSIIEIKENEALKILEVDDNIYRKESEMYLNKESIYIINNNSVSYSLINSITKTEIIFNCKLRNKSYCYPIFNLATNKLIGIYQNNFIYYHKGIFFKYIIMQLESKYLKQDLIENYNNEINILLKIDNKDVDNEVYFLDNEYVENNIRKSSHDNLKELNELNTKLYIEKGNQVKIEKYKKYFIPEEKGIYNIKIKFKINLKNCSYMFAGCEKIINIDFRKFITNYVKNMRYMFYGCENLKNINLYSFNTINCKDMSNMFEKCKNLEYLDLSFLRINKRIDLSNMFVDCLKLNKKFLKRVDFNQMKQLNLINKEISDINVLERVDFKQLQQLNISENQISNIEVLKNVDFKQLQLLNFSYNKIKDINILESVDFKQLRQLNFKYNKISDINILERADFKQLRFK